MVRDVSRLASASTIAQVVLAIGAMVAANQLDPLAFGRYAVYFGFVSVFSFCGSAKYENAYFLVSNKLQEANLTVLIVALALFTSALATALFYTLFARVLGLSTNIGIFVFLAALGQALSSSFLVQRVSEGHFGLIARTRITRAIATVAVWIIGIEVLSTNQDYALYFGAVLGAWVANGRLANEALREAWKRRGAITLRRIAGLTSRYRRFPAYEAPSIVIRVLGQHGQVFLAAALFGPSAAGLVGLSNFLVTKPLSVVMLSFGSAMQRRRALSRKSMGSASRARQGMNFLALLCGVGVVVSVGVVAIAPVLASLVLPDSWTGLSDVLYTVVPRLLGLVVIGTLTMLLSVEERQHEILVVESCTAAITYAAFLMGYLVFNDLVETLWVSSLSVFVFHMLFVSKVASAWWRSTTEDVDTPVEQKTG